MYDTLMNMGIPKDDVFTLLSQMTDEVDNLKECIHKLEGTIKEYKVKG